MIDDDIELEVFHRRIEILFDRFLQAMNLIYKEDVTFLEIRQKTSQVRGFFDGGSAGAFQTSSHCFRNNVCEGRFSETGRAVKENMIERLLNIEIDEGGAFEVARRSRGTPRIANNLLRRVRDFAQVKGDGRVTQSVADKALALLDIDRFGLDEMDKRILEAITYKFGGGPVGANSLAVAVGEEPDTIEEVYEPYLIMEGYLSRTTQGRVVTELCYKRLGVVPVRNGQNSLF